MEFECGRYIFATLGAEPFWLLTVARWACIPFSVLGLNTNVSFVDGHVEPVALESLKRLQWHQNFIFQEWTPRLPLR